MTWVQICSLSGSLFFLALILFAVRKEKLQEAYALIWLFTGCLLIVLSIFTRLLNLLAGIMGIQTPAFALLLFLVGGMLLMLFQCSIIISSLRTKITRLTEESTLLKEELEQMRKNSPGAANDK